MPTKSKAPTKAVEAPKPVTYGGVKVVPAAELNEPNSIMLLGRAKIGKSTLMASTSEVKGLERVLFIDCEMGAGAFAESYPNVDVVQIPLGEINVFESVMDDILDAGDDLPYDAVAVDTLSTLQSWAIQERGGGKKLEYEDWRIVGDWTMNLLWNLHYAKFLGLTSLHVKIDQNPLTKEIRTVPKLQGAAKFAAASVPDLVMMLSVVDTNSGPLYVADHRVKESSEGGNRFPQLPEKAFGNSTMSQVYGYIRGEDVDAPDVPLTRAEKAVLAGDAADGDADADADS